MTTYSPLQFVMFRIALGVYVMSFGLLVLPYSTELLAANGMLERYWPGFRFFPNAFPNVLAGKPDAALVQTVVLVLILAGAGLVFGVLRRTCALVAWYGLACLLDRNTSLMNPAVPFAGWLCLASMIVPLGEGWSVATPRRLHWRMPPELFRAAWIVMAVAYTFSGLVKLTSAAWVDGSALQYIVHMPFARQGGVARWFASLPEALLRLATWATLIGEIAFLPLCYWPLGRILAWSSMVAMHAMLLLVMDFPELTGAMFLVHIFTWDPSWGEGLRCALARPWHRLGS